MLTDSPLIDSQAQDAFAPRTPHIIGRQQHITSIRDAIGDESGLGYVFFFSGPGGVGKTRLLEEIANLLQQWSGPPVRLTSIIDLYHTDYHSPDGLRRVIADSLDPDNAYFHEYRNLRHTFERKHREGIASRDLEELRRQFDATFQQGYAALAAHYRPVLRFDTLELVQYESDIVQEICQAHDVDTVVKNWLLEQISTLPNTVTLFAARPRLRIRADFDKRFTEAGQQFQFVELQALSQAETEAYLDMMCLRHPSLKTDLDEEVRARVFQITRGRPIYLTLVVDLLLHGQALSQIFPVITTTEQVVNEETVGRDLVERLQQLPNQDGELMYFLMHARKGLDADLLSHLLDNTWTAEQIEAALARVREFAFVKVRPDTKQLFLHDEVYDLCDHYYRTDVTYGRQYEPIAEYYRQRLEASTSAREREDIMITLLYYELQSDIRRGYHQSYARWDEDAIKHYEIGLDMRLRDEMLRFLDRYARVTSPFCTPRVARQIDLLKVDRDSALLWVKRYLARGEFEKARQVAEHLRFSNKPEFAWDRVSDPFYKADLLNIEGEALVHSGAPEEKGLHLLEQAVDLLTHHTITDATEEWRRARILGRAHTYIGYYYRTHGRYGLALQAYKRALPYFNRAHISDERANTLNNLAFLLALLGRVNLALHHVEQALKIRQLIGHPYPIALSHNTRGLVFTLQDHPMWGVRECRIALRICEEIQEHRGVGLACNGIGVALRKHGDQWKLGAYSHAQAEELFEEAARYLQRAAHIFTNHVSEPIRRWEAYNELGSLYCDWGWLDRQKPDGHQEALDRYAQSIEYQEQALAIAQEYDLQFPVADSYDDLAQVYGDRSLLLAHMDRDEEAEQNLETAEGMLTQELIMVMRPFQQQSLYDRQQAETYLEEVLDMVPEAFHLVKGAGFREAPEPGEAYWLSLGKVHLQRGIWSFREVETYSLEVDERDQRVAEGIRYFTLATAYLQRYWPQSFALDNTLRSFANRLAELNPPAELAREIVQQIAGEYILNLNQLLETIDNVLGV
jgi:tetratricopeptide (TPR) repeat protein